MRRWLMSLIELICTGLFIVSFCLFVVGAAVGLFGGGARLEVEEKLYKIEFANPGDSCSEELDSDLHLNIEDGSPLSCTTGSIPYARDTETDVFHPPGFTDAQAREVITLAERLGSNGLAVSDQRRIQDRLDEIAATVPVADRPWEAVWGPRLLWWGVGMVVVGAALGCLGLVGSRRGRRISRSAIKRIDDLARQRGVWG